MTFPRLESQERSILNLDVLENGDEAQPFYVRVFVLDSSYGGLRVPDHGESVRISRMDQSYKESLLAHP